jgi:hypothetical protein
VSPGKKITVELQFRHAQTICSSEILHPVPLESPANTKRRGIRRRRLKARRATTRSFPCVLKDFKRMRNRWIVQKRAFQSAGDEGNAKCLLPSFRNGSGATPSLLTRTEQYSTLEESVDYSKCTFQTFYRGGFFWLDTPWCPPVAPCPSLII